MPGKADKPTQNSALQGILEQENFMIKILFICHGNNPQPNNPVYNYKDQENHKSINSPSYIHSA